MKGRTSRRDRVSLSGRSKVIGCDTVRDVVSHPFISAHLQALPTTRSCASLQGGDVVTADVGCTARPDGRVSQVKLARRTARRTREAGSFIPAA